MLKVILRVKEVSLHIKDGVQVKILIRKNEEYFNQGEKFYLIDGKVEIDLTSEFFINKQSPSFQIQIIIRQGKVNKLGGSIHINLRQFDQFVWHHTISRLLKSPDKIAQIDFSLIYFQSTLINQNCALISSQSLEKNKQKQISQPYEKKSQILKVENERLSKELCILQRKYEINYAQKMEGLQRQKQYSKQLFQKNKKLEQSIQMIDQNKRVINNLCTMMQEKDFEQLYQKLYFLKKNQQLNDLQQTQQIQSAKNQIH